MRNRIPAARRGAAICALSLAFLAGLPLASPAQNLHTLPLVLPASSAGLEGFVRIVNRSGQAGTVRMTAIDDNGDRSAPVTLALEAEETVNFRSSELERGAASKGLPVGVGDGEGNWRLVLETGLVIQPLAYIRTADGFVTSMHDVVPVSGGERWVVFFNPGSNNRQVSLLRLINPGTTAAEVEVTARDDAGAVAPGGAVRLRLPAGASRTLTAQELEAGGDDFTGSLGDGAGKWRLSVTSNAAIEVMNMLRTPTGHLANLSTAPNVVRVAEGAFRVPEMVTVPAGSYLMGAPESEARRRSNEGPVHLVTIGYSFDVGKYEVTRGEFARFVSETGHVTANLCRRVFPFERRSEWSIGHTWRNPGFDQTDDHPVVCVDWFDAKAYVEWLSEKTGDEYRLLSESEWEYVARGGTVTPVFWEGGADGQCRYANAADANTVRGWSVDCDDGYTWSAPVGSYEANPFGVHDTAGNVWEWVEDDSCNNDYVGAPVDGSAWICSGLSKLARGGGYVSSLISLRSAYRDPDRPLLVNSQSGFRIARSLTPNRSAAESVTEAGTGQEPGAGAIGQGHGHGAGRD